MRCVKSVLVAFSEIQSLFYERNAAMSCVKSVLVAFVALFVLASTIAQATTLGPKITVSAVSVNQPENVDASWPIGRLIDDSGMSGPDLGLQSPASSSDAPGGNNWAGMWRQGVSDSNHPLANSQITFDLGAVTSLSGMAVWNYDEWQDWPAYVNHNDRGIQQFTLWSSNDGTNYTQVGSTDTLAEAVCTGVLDAEGGHDTFDLTGLNARYLRMNLVSTFSSNTTNIYGLGEVRFYSAVPEPSAVVLLGRRLDRAILPTPGGGGDRCESPIGDRYYRTVGATIEQSPQQLSLECRPLVRPTRQSRALPTARAKSSGSRWGWRKPPHRQPVPLPMRETENRPSGDRSLDSR